MNPTDRLQVHVSGVTFEVFALAVVVALIGYIAMPRRLRIDISLALAVFWLTVGMMEEWRALWSVAKVTSVVPLLLVGAAAVQYPAEKMRRMPMSAFAYPYVALVLVVIAVFGSDRRLGTVLALQWLVIVAAALLLVRTVGNGYPISRVVLSFSIGSAVSVVLATSQVLMSSGFGLIDGRLWLLGSNPNQLGTLLQVAVPLLFYQGVVASRALARYLFVSVGVAGAGMTVLTGSRSAMLFVALGLLPVIWHWVGKRFVPVAVIACGAVLLVRGPLSELGGSAGGLDRLGHDSGRLELLRFHWQQVVEAQSLGQIFFGELTGKTRPRSATVLLGPHNVYLSFLYVGGFVVAALVLALVFLAMVRAVLVLKARPTYAPRLLLSVLAIQLSGIYLAGWTSEASFHPTSPLAIWQCVLALFFIVEGYHARRRPALDSGTSIPTSAGAANPDSHSTVRATVQVS